MECVLFLHAERMFVIKYIFSRKVAKSRRETEGFSSLCLKNYSVIQKFIST